MASFSLAGCPISTKHVNVQNLWHKCPCSLLSVLDLQHLDRSMWLESFWEKKTGIETFNTYHKISHVEYHTLRVKEAPHAIRTMCILTIKKDKMMNPLHVK